MLPHTAVALLLGFSLASGAAAQTTLLFEDFNSGVVPPAGWTEENNGVGEGWKADVSGMMAWHSDDAGANDNALLSPALDFTALTEASVSGLQGQVFAAWREQNLIQVSLDGGLSFQTVGQIDSPDGMGIPFQADLSAFVGQASVQLGLRYQGNFANQWFVDQVEVSDQAPPPPAPLWPNLPTTFQSGQSWSENFDAITPGNLPSYMAVNSVDSYTRLADSEGWCNAGQIQASPGAYSGNNALEMGLVPGVTNYHDVSNALILGLNGSAVQDFYFSLHARQFGDEVSPDDGIWLSLNGSDWHQVTTDWQALTGGEENIGEWVTLSFDLAASSLDLSGDFYLAIAQQDNYPFKNQDGVSVDQLALDRPVLNVVNMVVNETAVLTVENVNPYSLVLPLQSLFKGTSQTAFGQLDLGHPFESLGFLRPNGAGYAEAQFQVPYLAKDKTFYIQALEVNGLEARISNLLVETVTN